MSKSVFLPPEQVRTISIIAHVDHGKTTLADNLIERNGIISERLAGTMRYLDSLEDEQRRGITMRASAIGLKHTYIPPGGKNSKKKQQQQQQQEPQNMIIHLLDSPGHTDFSSEVSSSLQCCDGALLVVDAVEGMCARTHQVLREAHVNQLVPILVINKVDRLCTDLCLSANEAYLRLRSLVENVNAASAAMLTSSRYQTVDEAEQEEPSSPPAGKSGDDQKKTTSKEDEEEEAEEEDELWTFEPMKGNVIFTSALYGWGFTVPSLARHLFRSKTIPMKPLVLKQYLFGDFKYRDEKVLKWRFEDTNEFSLFAEFALQPLWKVYEGVAAATASLGLDSGLFADGRASLLPSSTGIHNGSTNNHNPNVKITSKTPGMEQVLEAMQIGATGPHTPKTSEDVHAILSQTGSNTEEAVLRSLLRRYRPLSDVVLDTVCEYCPSPTTAASTARPRALGFVKPSEPSEYFNRMQKAAAVCDPSPEGPTVAHVCKFMGADRRHVRDPALSSSGDANSEEDDNVIMGLARVLCGTLKTGTEYYVMGPKHKTGQEAPRRKIRLYLLMGSEFLKVDEVPAGHLCAIHNLEDVQLKTVTISDQPEGMPLQGFERGIRPLVKVNVEAVDAADTDVLERGLLQLSLADAAVEVIATSKGERILACLGEIHLEQSISDLRKVYCKKKDIEIRVSDPIVEFGETTDWFTDKQEDADFRAFFDDPSPVLRQTKIPPYNEEEGLVYARHGRTRAIVSGRCAAISLRVVPLSPSVHQAMQGHKVVSQDCEQDLLRLGRALQCYENENEFDADSIKADEVLSILCDSLCALDNNGNALVQSRSMSQGIATKGVESGMGKIYVPPSVDKKAESEEVEQDEDENQDGDEDSDIAANNVYRNTEEYDLVRSRIRRYGLYGIGKGKKIDKDQRELENMDQVASQTWKDNLSSAVAGFHIAVRAGPICEEPVRNVLVVLEGFEVAVSKREGTSSDQYECTKRLTSGTIMSAMRTGIRSCLLTRPARLVEGYLLLTLHSSLNGLGPVYAVLSRRRGKVVRDDMVDGTDLLMISATLPQAESFGLAPELYQKSSGQVTAPELIFSHWQTLDEDPFWIPTSLEEREDFGEILQSGDVSTGMDNTALNLIRKVRIRKGLLVESNRTVVAAEKQRTRKR